MVTTMAPPSTAPPRVMAVGAGGQVLASQSPTALPSFKTACPTAVSLRDLGEHRLKDLVRPERVYQIIFMSRSPFRYFPLSQFAPAPFPTTCPSSSPVLLAATKRSPATRRLLAATRLLTLTGPGWHGQDPAHPSACRRGAARFCRWRLAGRAGAASRSGLPTAPRARRHLRPARKMPGRPLSVVLTDYLRAKSTAACPGQLRTPDRGLRLACSTSCCTPARTCSRILVTQSRGAGCGRRDELSANPSLTLAAPAGNSDPGIAVPELEAVCLFVERAQVAQPHFTLTTAQHPAARLHLSGVSMAFRWHSNWPRPGSRCCPPTRSPPALMIVSVCWWAAVAPPCRASRPCGR